MSNENSKPKPVSAFELFNKSWTLIQENLTPFIIVYALPFVLSLGNVFRTDDVDNLEKASDFSFGGLPLYANISLIGLGIILAIAFFVVLIYIQAMTYILQLKSAQGQKPDIQKLFETAKKYWLRLFGLGIIVGLAVIAGLLLFIVPGIIFIRRYFLSAYVMIDKDVGIGAAMKQSADLSKPYSGYVYSVIGVFILLSLPSIVPIIGPLATFALTFAYSVAPALRYEELKKLA